MPSFTTYAITVSGLKMISAYDTFYAFVSVAGIVSCWLREVPGGYLSGKK